MKANNINSESMKRNNFSVVLNAIRKQGMISRKDLADITGLTAATVTNIVNAINKGNLLVELGEGLSNGGRKPIMLGINPDVLNVIGVELNASNITFIATNFKADIIYHDTCKANLQEGKDAVLKRLVDFIEESIENSRIDRKKILGIGITSAGPYDLEKGIMINPPNFPGWFNVPIKDIISEHFGIDCYFEKETVAFTFAEYWLGHVEKAHSVFGITVNEIGVGGGLVIDGQRFHGFENGAGDVGHMIVDPNGLQCTCGSVGCLEAMVSAPAILENIRNKTGKVYESIRQVITNARDGDETCLNALADSARLMGNGIANIINIISPEVIVLGGDLIEAYGEYFDIAVQEAKKRKYPLYNQSIEIIPASFGDNQNAMGGISIILQNFYEGMSNLFSVHSSR